MRAAVTTHTRSSSSARLARDVRRALLACGVVIGFCAIVGFLTTGSALWTKPQPQTSSEAGLSTGSVLFVTPTGCRERTIDNDTWRIRDGAMVDCAEALARSAGGASNGQWSGSRVDIIREGFRGKH